MSLGLAIMIAGAGTYVIAGGSVQAGLLADASAFGLAVDVHDPIAGVFLLLVGLVGALSVVQGRRDALPSGGRLLVPLFVVGMALVVMSANVFTLFLAWEMMSAAPGLMLVLESRPAARRAGLVYLTYSQFAVVALLTGFLLWGNGNLVAFDALAIRPLPIGAASLLTLGCAIKAGIMPFHSWLPEAHPEAPGHVSALMSGVMVAIPSFLLIRFVLPVHVPSPLALAVLLLGALTSALGSLHSFHTRDIKRVLAFTTIAHMGVLFAALGAGMMARSAGDVAVASFLASAVAVYVLAHGLAKAALFLMAGEIHHLTGDLDLERIGGLWRHSRTNAGVGATAAAALAGLPPFGGFVAELGLLAGFLATLPLLHPIDGVALLGALFLLAIGMGAGLAAVAKFFLGIFHGPSRLPVPHGRSAVGPIATLLVFSLALGVLPGILWAPLGPYATSWIAFSTPVGAFGLLPLAGLTALVTLLVGTLGWSLTRRARVVDVWACGLPPPSPRQTYSANGLVMPFRILFAEILRPGSDLRLQEAPIVPFAPAKGQYDDPTPSFVEPWIHRPVLRRLLPSLERLRLLHRGPVQTYLIIALLFLVALLFLLPVIP